MIAALLALAMRPPAADPPPPVWQGVWTGTIGASPVQVCLSRRTDELSVGSYYYRSKLRTIALEQQGTSRMWSEGEGAHQPRWTFATVTATALAGRWTDGTRVLPFRLARVPGDDDGAPCASEPFNGPRWRPLTVTSKAAMLDGTRYVDLTWRAGPAFPDLSLTGFRLLGDDSATRAINASLRSQVLGPDEDWRACIAGGLDMRGVDGDYRASIAPTVITPRWLAAQLDTEQDCGGVHPNNATVPLTFDRATGRAVDLDAWLNDTALDRHGADKTGPFAVTPPLHRLLVRRSEPDCREALEGAGFWDVGLEHAGLTFQPELGHADQACADPVSVPWSALAPYLDAAGRAGRASLVPVRPPRPSAPR